MGATPRRRQSRRPAPPAASAQCVPRPSSSTPTVSPLSNVICPVACARPGCSGLKPHWNVHDAPGGRKYRSGKLHVPPNVGQNGPYDPAVAPTRCSVVAPLFVIVTMPYVQLAPGHSVPTGVDENDKV